MNGSITRQGTGPVVTTRTVRTGDVVHVRGGWRTVRDLRALSGGDRVLLFDGGITYRLIPGANLRLSTAPEAPPPVVWRAQPDTRPHAGPIHLMQCAACRQQSPPATNPATTREWITAHAGLHPAHRTYRQITTRPWHATPTTQQENPHEPPRR